MNDVCEAVRNCKAHLVAKYSGKFKLPRRENNALTDPELDVSPDV